jgi:BirA family biotin operon repressor/biotin-[acetyl-CoA-carboxylase] ligase
MSWSDLSLPGDTRLAAFGEIDSTNAEAFRRIADGESGPLWIVADQQLQGRARRGRNWISEPGNLYASLVLRPGCPLGIAAQLSFVAGLALLRAVGDRAPALAPALALKWPNDLLVNGRKIAGILMESTDAASGELVLVIGCGVNLTRAPAGTEFPATSLRAEGVEVAPEPLLEALAAHFDRAFAEWAGGTGFADTRAHWLAHAHGRGGPIRVRLWTGDMEGTFEDIDDNGALILRLADGSAQTIAAGDVFFGGPAPTQRSA